MKNKMLLSLLATAFSSALLTAQPPPPGPPPMAGPSSTVAGSISQFNYGPSGRVEGFVLSPNTLVFLPPGWAMEVELLAKTGDQITATGSVTSTTSGMQTMDAQTIAVAGKTLTFAPPSAPAPYAASGVIRTLNYGRQGEVNGFVFQNGIIALTPPIGTSDVSVVRQGVTISVSGFARSTPGGRTVVEVQSITANGQTIAMNAGSGRPGPRGVPPPPPPPDR